MNALSDPIESGRIIIDQDYYTFQHRVVAKGEWCNIDSPLVPVENPEWFNSSWDVFHFKGTSEDHLKNYSDLWQKHRIEAFTDFNLAKSALERVRRKQLDGAYFYKDSYGKVHQRVQYEFRIIHITRKIITDTVIKKC